MNSKLEFLSPVLWTKDLEQTISFYETVLGFKKKTKFPNFVSLTRDNGFDYLFADTIYHSCFINIL